MVRLMFSCNGEFFATLVSSSGFRVQSHQTATTTDTDQQEPDPKPPMVTSGRLDVSSCELFVGCLLVT